MVETARPGRRGLTGSWANFGSLAGTLLGSGFAAAMNGWLSPAALETWGWRVPFLCGGVLCLGAYIYVRRLAPVPQMAHHETQHGPDRDSPLREALTRDLRTTLLAVAFTCGYGVFFYMPLVYLPTYASSIGGIDNSLTLAINFAGIALAMPLIPLVGWLSDRLVRRRRLLLVIFAATVVLGWPLMALAGQGIAQAGLSILIAFPLGAAPALFVEMFPAEDRLSGYSLAYNLGYGIIGGTAPMLATWLISETGLKSAPGLYLAALALVSVIALWLMVDRSREPLR